MNLGLGNLGELKMFLLAPTQVTQTTFDQQLIALGKGTASAMENRCNREFGYQAEKIDEFCADRSYYVLRNYPINAVTKVEVSSSPDVWTELTGIIRWVDKAKGIVFLHGTQGSYHERIRFTYSGGYWFDTSDDSEDLTAKIKSGVEDLDFDAEDIDVVFGTPFDSAPSNVIVNVNVPGDGTQITANVVAGSITANGFTARLSFPIPGAGYELAWIAYAEADTETSPDQPAGSALRPDDLKLAWLLQCQSLWSVRDNLGAAVAMALEGKSLSPELTVTKYTLVPEVLEVIRRYYRTNPL